MLAIALLGEACVDKKQLCDPATDDSCLISPQGNPCKVDADCGDGRNNTAVSGPVKCAPLG